MQITRLMIRNWRTIRELEIKEIESALILVGRNNTGKTVILDALQAAFGLLPHPERYLKPEGPHAEIEVTLSLSETDLSDLHSRGKVSRYKRFEAWHKQFLSRIPDAEKDISFTTVINHKGEIRHLDRTGKPNRYLPECFPHLYVIDTSRNAFSLQEDLMLSREDEQLIRLKKDICMFDSSHPCTRCFRCIGLLEQKTAAELKVHETARLLEYKMVRLGLKDFEERVNACYHKNGGVEELSYSLAWNPSSLFKIHASASLPGQNVSFEIDQLGNGMKCLYMLSLLETYAEDESRLPSILLVEYPEFSLHPSLQKTAGEILYRLSRKNQIFFTTHSSMLLSNFTARQLRQVVTGPEGDCRIQDKTDLSLILNDLGYSAGDFMGVDFVFIVEGKQDKSRLPLLLKKYYSDLYNDKGELTRISILTTNSCTNIRTYANLKYLGQTWLKDQFLMIRDGDGKDPNQLRRQLCSYYAQSSRQEADPLPRVQERNVLILKYYSFENYFLNPSIMARLGIVKSEEAFWNKLLRKWNEYLSRLSCGVRLVKTLGHPITTVDDLKENYETFLICMRGHNLYDIFYGRYRKNEEEILKAYIDLAPREDFADILDAIDAFLYFDNRKQSK